MLQRIQPALLFFFGSGRRALYSVIGLLVLIAICYPPAIMWALGQILLALSPLITLVVVVAIFVAAFKFIFGGFKLTKEKKKDG